MAPIPLFQASHLDIFCDEDKRWLYLNWKGYQTEQSIKAGCEVFLELMTQQQVCKVLNDNTNLQGTWLNTARWLVFDLLPRAKQAGLRQCAHVYGPKLFSRLSADAVGLILDTRAERIRAFPDIDAARAWLSEATQTS